MDLYQKDDETNVCRREDTAHEVRATVKMPLLIDIARTNSEVYRFILSAQNQPNVAELAGQHFIMQIDNGCKSITTQEFLK